MSMRIPTAITALVARVRRLIVRVRRAYLQMLIRSAEQDLQHIEAELVELPELAKIYTQHLEALRVEQASLRP